MVTLCGRDGVVACAHLTDAGLVDRGGSDTGHGVQRHQVDDCESKSGERGGGAERAESDAEDLQAMT